MNEYLEYVKSVDPEMPLVNEVQLAAQLGLDLNEVDRIIESGRKWIEDALNTVGCKAWKIAFAGAYLLSIKADYVSRRGWDEWMAFREFLQNALDTNELKGFGYVGSWAYVSDAGPGVPPSKATFFGASEKSLCLDRGVFGEGMKMGMLTFETKHMPTVVITNTGGWPIAYKYEILDDGRVIMLVYVLDRTECTKEDFVDIVLLRGTLVLVYDPGKRIDERVKDYGMRGISDAVTPQDKIIGKAEFSAPAESGFRCPEIMESYLLKDTTALYVRGIFVRPEMPGFLPNNLGYDMWWFYLDPNRNNVDTSKTNVGRVTVEFYTHLEPLPEREEEFYNELSKVVSSYAKCSMVAGTTPILHLNTNNYESIGALFLSEDHAKKVLGRVAERVCKLPLLLFKAALYKPNPPELATYAHYVSKPAIAIENPPYFVTEEEVMARLSLLGLQDAKDAIRDEIARSMGNISYDPTNVPDAGIIRSAFEKLGEELISEEIKVLIGGKRSFSVPESRTIVLAERLVRLDVSYYMAKKAIATFLHELAHIYAYITYGVADDLTEQHVEAIQTLGAKLALEQPATMLSRAIANYLTGYLDIYIDGVVCGRMGCSIVSSVSIHRTISIPRAEIGAIYREYRETLPGFIGFYAYDIVHPHGEAFLKAMYTDIYTPESVIRVPIFDMIPGYPKEIMGRILVMNTCLAAEVKNEEAREACRAFGEIDDGVFDEAEKMLQKVPLKELEKALREVRARQKKFREKYLRGS